MERTRAGMKLQRATSLENPNWQSLQNSELTNAVELPLWEGSDISGSPTRAARIWSGYRRGRS